MELIPEYVKAKKGITPIKYLHPLLETSAPTRTA